MATSFIILAAGRGTRLGGSVPKPLTVLEDGRTILEQQLANITEVFGADALASTSVVVGYRAEDLIAALPSQVSIVLNSDYGSTNTSKSLLRALDTVPEGNGALWFNGDVVFDAEILRTAKTLIDSDSSFAVVTEGVTAEEEVKYTLTESGFISAISKEVKDGLGEAVGINHVSSRDLKLFLASLGAVEPSDYFEAAMEATIWIGASWKVLPVGDSYAVEVDFPEDLTRANSAQSNAAE